MENTTFFTIQDCKYYTEVYIDIVDPNIERNAEYLPIEVDNDIYLFLKLIGITEAGVQEQLEVKDYFILNDLAIDCKNGLFRLYPKLPNEFVEWNPNTHTLSAVAEVEASYRMA